MVKGQFVPAGRHYRKAAEYHEMAQEFDRAITSYKKASECYFKSKKFVTYSQFLTYRVMNAQIDPSAKVEILEDAAGKLAEAGQEKKAAKIQQKIAALKG